MALQAVSTVAVDHAERIAVGLERIAADLRKGALPFSVRKCIVLVSGPDTHRTDNVGMMYFGADASLAETVGLLELAKIQAIDDEAV